MTEASGRISSVAPNIKVEHTRCCPRLRCSQLFLLYLGRRGQLMLDAFEFIRRTGILDRNLIMFRDHEQLHYQKGLSPEIPSMSRFIEWQISQRQSHFPHVRTTYCLGTSIGGYAAIVSGFFLKVPIVWSFGPMTLIEEPFNHYATDEVSRRTLDLAELLREGNGVTEYRIFYNEFQPADVRAAERLRGCPGVRLLPQPGEGHGVVTTLANLGKLDDLLVPFESV